MTNNNKTAIKVLVIIAIVGGCIWYFTKGDSKKDKTKKDYVDNIYNNVIDNRSIEVYNLLSSYDLDYLKTWSDAIDAKVSIFDYSGKKYLTSSGTVTAGGR